MKLNQFKFLIMFWIIAIVFLVGEYVVVIWRNEKLFDRSKMNYLLYDIKGENKINNICHTKLSGRGISYNLIQGNFYCKDGSFGMVSFSRSVIGEGHLKYFINEVNRLAYNSEVINKKDWKCIDSDDNELSEYSIIDNKDIVKCYEK